MSFGETITVKRGPIFDGNGDPIPGSGSFPVNECIVKWPDSEDRIALGRNGVVMQCEVYTSSRPPEGILHTDEIVVRGLTFRVDGLADDWIDPEEPDFGGIVITGKRGEG